MRLREGAARRQTPVHQPDNGTRSDAGASSPRARGRAPVGVKTRRRGDNDGSQRKRLAKTQTEDRAVNEYIVRVPCSGTTLYAFVLEGAERFITYDEKPRLLTRDDALEIQGRLPQRHGECAISIEKVEKNKM